jgi:hypothetical protein
VFGQVFVQRTRAGILQRYGDVLHFPERNVLPEIARASAAHDAFFAELAEALGALSVAYHEPFRALQRAVAACLSEDGEPDQPPASNLHRSFVVQPASRPSGTASSIPSSAAPPRSS